MKLLVVSQWFFCPAPSLSVSPAQKLSSVRDLFHRWYEQTEIAFMYVLAKVAVICWVLIRE